MTARNGPDAGDEDDDQEDVAGAGRPDEDDGESCPLCGYFNSPADGDTCNHLRAWVWDDVVEGSPVYDEFAAAWSDFSELASNAEDVAEFADNALGLAESLVLPDALVAYSHWENAPLDVFVELSGAAVGEGWTLSGPLGGSGYCVYLESDERANAATDGYRALLAAIDPGR
ncbi:MAG: hypothetical protein K2W80_13080 [Burkholderiales bacterium]|jgi:hypothetical protein|nr:hypothetical protein [Burkholderiales bacterium]